MLNNVFYGSWSSSETDHVVTIKKSSNETKLDISIWTNYKWKKHNAHHGFSHQLTTDYDHLEPEDGVVSNIVTKDSDSYFFDILKSPYSASLWNTNDEDIIFFEFYYPSEGEYSTSKVMWTYGNSGLRAVIVGQTHALHHVRGMPTDPVYSFRKKIFGLF